MSDNTILNEVILGYRRFIEERYQLAALRNKYEIPASFDEERVALFRDYFLNYLYPHPVKRAELDAAFSELDSYIKNPEKLFRILVDSGSVLFKYGRHLPKIFKSGMKALRSFRTAVDFENNLVKQAASSQLKPPYSKTDIETLLSGLSSTDIDQFIANNQELFEIFRDRSLVKKIIEITEHMIVKMKKRPKVYSPEEVRGLEIGLEIIVKGDQLFDRLSKEEQQKIFGLVIRIEREVLQEIFNRQ